jgi:hypothetical protein
MKPTIYSTFTLLDETHGFFLVLQNWVQVGSYNMKHPKYIYGAIHMHIVHHCISSTC